MPFSDKQKNFLYLLSVYFFVALKNQWKLNLGWLNWTKNSNNYKNGDKNAPSKRFKPIVVFWWATSAGVTHRRCAVGWWYSKRPLFLVGDSWIKERSSWQWTQQEDPRNLLTAEFSVQNKKLNFQPRTKLWLGRTISKPATTFKDQTGKTSFNYKPIFWCFFVLFLLDCSMVWNTLGM